MHKKVAVLVAGLALGGAIGLTACGPSKATENKQLPKTTVTKVETVGGKDYAVLSDGLKIKIPSALFSFVHVGDTFSGSLAHPHFSTHG